MGSMLPTTIAGPSQPHQEGKHGSAYSQLLPELTCLQTNKLVHSMTMEAVGSDTAGCGGATNNTSTACLQAVRDEGCNVCQLPLKC